MQIMMLAVLLFSGYNMVNFFSNSKTKAVGNIGVTAIDAEIYCGNMAVFANDPEQKGFFEGEILFKNNCAHATN